MENQRLFKELEESYISSDEVAVLRSKIAELQSKLDAATANADVLQSEALDTSHKAMAALQQQYELKDGSFRELQANFDRVETENDILRREKIELLASQQELALLRQTCGTQERELLALRSAIGSVRSESEQIQSMGRNPDEQHLMEVNGVLIVDHMQDAESKLWPSCLEEVEKLRALCASKDNEITALRQVLDAEIAEKEALRHEKTKLLTSCGELSALQNDYVQLTDSL